MHNDLIETIISEDNTIRNRSVDSLLKNKEKKKLMEIAKDLESFRKQSDNLYHKVRACLFLFVIYRFYLQSNKDVIQYGTIPINGVKAALNRNFESSIEIYLNEMSKGKENSALFSAIAQSYYKLAFKYLLEQVKLSISKCDENFHLFNIKSLSDYPFTVQKELTTPNPKTDSYPIVMVASPVRIDPSHSAWSDIFFLGMDFPEGARVVNISVNLKIHGDSEPIKPPCECYCRFIEEPVIKLNSVDLKKKKKKLYNR